MIRPSIVLLLSSVLSFATSSLLVDFKGSDDTSALGSCQLEGQNLGDHIPCPGNDQVFIKPGRDPAGKAALTYHRDPHFRRTEVRAGEVSMWEAEKTYFIGYSFMLSNIQNSLVIFQWKRDNKKVPPKDNIPFHMEFSDTETLNLQVTTPGGSGSNRKTIASAKLKTHQLNHIALAIDTKMNGGGPVSKNNRIAWWVNGKKVHDAAEYSTWSSKTKTYPKFGLYRGENDGGSGGGSRYTYDSFVYRVQISDKSLKEISDSSGGVKG